MQWVSFPWFQLSRTSAPYTVSASMGQSTTMNLSPTGCPKFLVTPRLPFPHTLRMVAASYSCSSLGGLLVPCLVSHHHLTNYPYYVIYLGKNLGHSCFTDWTLTDTILYILPYWYIYPKGFIIEMAIIFHVTQFPPRKKNASFKMKTPIKSFLETRFISLSLRIFQEPSPSLHCLQSRQCRQYDGIVCTNAWK